jgi:ribosomal protein S18 acetylase RimI-like enzyme
VACPRLAGEVRDDRDVDVMQAGALNLAGFVGSTAGRLGVVKDIRGGVAVAGPIPVSHAYVTTAIPTRPGSSAVEFFDDAVSFFAGLERTFVLWAPMSDPSFAEEAARRNLVADKAPSPAMVISTRTEALSDLRFHLVDNEQAAAIFGDVCERGYEAPRMAGLLAHQQGYSAPNTYWYIAFDGEVPVSAACGYLHGETGGIYSVATPGEFRGRGFAAMVTSMVTNHLFNLGATGVVLQASKLGFGVYERLGFRVYEHYERFTIAPQEV